MPKKVYFNEFLKIWSWRSNSVTRQVNFNRTKMGGKCQNWKIQMRHFGWFSNKIRLLKVTICNFCASSVMCKSPQSLMRCSFHIHLMLLAPANPNNTETFCCFTTLVDSIIARGTEIWMGIICNSWTKPPGGGADQLWFLL